MAGQLWTTNNLDGYMGSDRLSKVLRMAVQPMYRFRQFCDVEDASVMAKHRGQEFRWDVYSRVQTAGDVLTETVDMPETNFLITLGVLTVVERGNSVPYTGMLDDLSEHPVRRIIEKVLKNDCNDTQERGAHAKFDATPLTVTPAGGTSATAITLETTGTPTATNNVELSKKHVKKIVVQMSLELLDTLLWLHLYL